MSTFALEYTPPASTSSRRPAPRFTQKERYMIEAVARLGFRYGGARRRYNGWTLIFHAGPVGAVDVAFTCPRREIACYVLRFLAGGEIGRRVGV
jgi:hypothetical protein